MLNESCIWRICRCWISLQYNDRTTPFTFIVITLINSVIVTVVLNTAIIIINDDDSWFIIIMSVLEKAGATKVLERYVKSIQKYRLKRNTRIMTLCHNDDHHNYRYCQSIERPMRQIPSTRRDDFAARIRMKMKLRWGAKRFRRGDTTREEDISTPDDFLPATAIVGLVASFYQQLRWGKIPTCSESLVITPEEFVPSAATVVRLIKRRYQECRRRALTEKDYTSRRNLRWKKSPLWLDETRELPKETGRETFSLWTILFLLLALRACDPRTFVIIFATYLSTLKFT